MNSAYGGIFVYIIKRRQEQLSINWDELFLDEKLFVS